MRTAEAVSKIMERPYELGAQGEAFDCLTYIREFYHRQGIELPTEHKGITLDNYVEKWKAGEGREEFKEALLSLGQDVQVNYMREGDLIILDVEDTAYPCIYLGFDKVLIISIETGTIVMPLWAVKKKILAVRRLALRLRSGHGGGTGENHG